MAVGIMDAVLNNLVNYLFGSRTLLGLTILFTVFVAAIMARIDRSALFLLLAPLILAMAKFGYLPSVIGVVVFIGIFITWGIMFKIILGKKN